MKPVNRLSLAYMDTYDAFSAPKMEPKIKKKNQVRTGNVKKQTKKTKTILEKHLNNNS